MANNSSLPNAFPGMLGNQGAYVHPQQPTINKPAKKLPEGEKAGYNGTLVAVVLDESGSMMGCYDSTIDGLNEYINSQKNGTGQCLLKINKFESNKVQDIWGIRDVHETPAMSKDLYQPNGLTNLFDAIGQTIEQIDQYLAPIAEKDRPAVMIVIMTDGAENASRTYTNEDVRELVRLREEKDWGFTFLGANIDAFSAGSQFGMRASNTMQYSTASMGGTFASAAASTTRYRDMKSAGWSTDEVYTAGLYTDEDRKKAMGEDTDA